MIRHYKNVHKQNYIPNEKSEYKKERCLQPGCSQEFYHRTKLTAHLQKVHGVDVQTEEVCFKNFQQFLSWKEKEEAANFVYFSRRNAASETRLAKTYYFVCQHDGSDRVHRKKSEQNLGKKRNKKGRVRTGIVCPARMKVRVEKSTGEACLMYTKSHTHDISAKDTMHHPVPEQVKMEIVNKIQNGMSVNAIYKEVNDCYESRDNRQCLVSKKYIPRSSIERLQKTAQMSVSLDNNIPVTEDVNIHDKIEALMKEDYSPVLLYKPCDSTAAVTTQNDDFLHETNDLFLLGIQTKEQKLFFENFCAKIVFIDISENVTLQRYSLITLKVLNDVNIAVPVAHLLTNSKDSFVVEVFFKELKESSSCGENCKVVMTDVTSNMFKTFANVFNSDCHHLVCKWHLLKDWCTKICEEEQTDEAQRDIYFAMYGLLAEKNEEAFKGLMNKLIETYTADFPVFIDWFLSKYSQIEQCWASCYREELPYSNYDFALYQDCFQKQIKCNKKTRLKTDTVKQLLDLFLHIEQTYFMKQVFPAVTVESNIIVEHTAGLEIMDSCIDESFLSWTVTTQECAATVKLLSEVCDIDFCTGKCLEVFCFGLCSHLYRCSCKIKVKPCRHIHKVHSRRIGLQNIFDNENITEVVVDGQDDNSMETPLEDAACENVREKIVELQHMVNAGSLSLKDYLMVDSKLETILKKLRK